MTQHRRGIPPLALCLTLLVLAPATAASAFERLVFFGDSLSDPGNHFIAFGDSSRRPFDPIPDAPYAIGGHHFSNGRTWAGRLAVLLDLPASGRPALRNPGTFTNYAVGRARARADAPEFPDFDLATQVSRFLSDFGGAPAGALYVVWIGSTDLNDALNALSVDPSGQTSAGIIEAAVEAIAGAIQALWAAGARDILVLNLPDLANTPAVRSLGPTVEAPASQFTDAYDAGLTQALAAIEGSLPDIQLTAFDVDAFFDQILAAPGAFGLRNVTDSCLSFDVVAHAICRRPDRYLFWDGIHPTRAGHGALAGAVADILAP